MLGFEPISSNPISSFGLDTLDLLFKIPIEVQEDVNPDMKTLDWILSIRGADWILDERESNWVLDIRTTEWSL
tara:strand:- start:24312 stop:24530 length:219 start_codon:yes stop_codon:yes gene_type:complete